MYHLSRGSSSGITLKRARSTVLVNVALSEGGSFITLMGGIFSLVSVPIPARGAGY